MVLEQAGMVVTPPPLLHGPSPPSTSPSSLPPLPLFDFDNDQDTRQPQEQPYTKSETDLPILSSSSSSNITFYSPHRSRRLLGRSDGGGGWRERRRGGGLREGGPRRLASKKSVTWADESGSDLSRTFSTHSPTTYDRSPQFGEGVGGVDLSSFSFAIVFLMLFVVVIGGSLIHD